MVHSSPSSPTYSATTHSSNTSSTIPVVNSVPHIPPQDAVATNARLQQCPTILHLKTHLQTRKPLGPKQFHVPLS